MSAGIGTSLLSTLESDPTAALASHRCSKAEAVEMRTLVLHPRPGKFSMVP